MTTWIGPQDTGYDERRTLFNAMIDKRPRVIAACTTPADVREALERAAQDLLPVAVRSGGHKYERLARIKAEHDPHNVFAGNQDTRPVVPA